MFGFCQFCDVKCSERTFNRSFGKKKKPLVAISILVIVIMFLSLAEAAPRPPGHKRRHNRKSESDLLSPNDNEQRIIRKHADHHSAYMQREKKSKSLYKNESRIVHRKLQNMFKHFKKGIKDLNIIRNFTTGKPKWLPKVNFLSIHNTATSVNDIREQYKFVAKKLHQNLIDYKNVFELLLKMKVQANSNYYDELHKRQKFIDRTLTNINSTISDLTDGLQNVNVRIKYRANNDNTDDLRNTVDSTKYELIMKIGFRGFENALKHWISGFNCWFSVRHFECDNFEKRLLAKRDRNKH